MATNAVSPTPSSTASGTVSPSTGPSVRKSLGDLYRPQGPKLVQSGVAWSSGGQAQLTQVFDLSLPIRGFRLNFKGRLVIGTAAFTSVNPEGFLNLISNIIIQGTNARQKGNITLWTCDLATAWVMANLYGPQANRFTISTSGAGGDATVPAPNTPFPGAGTAVPNYAAGYINGATGTYDWIITIDLPFHPHQMNALGKSPYDTVGYLVRNEEWKDSLQLQMTFGSQTGASNSGSLGVAAATTTVTFTAYGLGSGSPSIDVYSLPVLMGLDLKDTVLPGVYTRITQPITSILQSAGPSTTILLNMQKQPTQRVIAKFGTSVFSPAFATLSDTIVSTIGINLGGNRTVRNNVDIVAHKGMEPDQYYRNPIQGYNLLDFMDSGNADSGFPGQDIGDGATFQLVGTVTGTANALGIIVQEQSIHIPTGALKNH
jgi:hypothetical protein